MIASIIGVSLTKLFQLNSDWENLRWLAGSLSTSITIVLMQITATTHPPAGATALLAVVNDDVVAIGWYLIAVTTLSSSLALVIALLVNNIQRRYPVYWWEPHSPVPVPRSPSVSKPPASNPAEKRPKSTHAVINEGEGCKNDDYEGVTSNEGDEVVVESQELEEARV